MTTKASTANFFQNIIKYIKIKKWHTYLLLGVGYLFTNKVKGDVLIKYKEGIGK